MRSDEIEVADCESTRKSLLAGRALTTIELAHTERCAICADAVTETEIEAALVTKPKTLISAEFAVGVAMRARGEKSARRWVRQKLAGGHRFDPHMGRNLAVVLLLVAMAVGTMCDPRWLTAAEPLRVTLMLLLMGEVAGIALWLGLRSGA